MIEHLHEECGVFGIVRHQEAAAMTYLGLFAMQHRGQEGAGIVTSNDGCFRSHRGMGLVNDVFKKEHIDHMPGDRAIGHVRYSTSGGSLLKNVQPIISETNWGPLAVAHNGNLVNAKTIRRQLECDGAIFSSTSDSEVLMHLLARSQRKDFDEALIDSCRMLEGAFSLVLMTRDAMYAVRDPHAFRPLCLGVMGDSLIACSETCALDLIGATYLCEVEPGQIVRIDDEGMFPFFYSETVERRHCIFEFIYFARPDSQVYGHHVQAVRKEIGRLLARSCPADADVVVPIPDSSVVAAIGYAEEAGLPFDMGIIRNHYVGRTFIEPEQRIRDFGVKLKHNVVSSIVKDKRVVLVDDSIVRGTTMRKMVKMLRDKGGAREVHLRISSPPIRHCCYYGIDTPHESELIASNFTLEEIRVKLGVDTLAYLPIEELAQAVKPDDGNYCYACFSGKYPVPVTDKLSAEALEIRQATLFDDLVGGAQRSVSDLHGAANQDQPRNQSKPSSPVRPVETGPGS